MEARLKGGAKRLDRRLSILTLNLHTGTHPQQPKTVRATSSLSAAIRFSYTTCWTLVITTFIWTRPYGFALNTSFRVANPDYHKKINAITHHWHTFQSLIEAGPNVIEFLGGDGRRGQATTLGQAGCGHEEAEC
ncbi:uncharacterized protein FFNC_15569 [Fusarium fujikuroi]|nr:uncharacterized protein FFNC_15569 [Fusarium fujikuroi]